MTRTEVYDVFTVESLGEEPETRLQDKMGDLLARPEVKRGYALFNPGEPTEGFTSKALTAKR